MKNQDGKMMTDYGKAICDMLGSQVGSLLRMKCVPEEAAVDLLRIRTVLIRMRMGIVREKEEVR